ncbi:hypothetical protein DQ04_00321100 [Trypanosoma grayi]|uniref:hypothetical protein n=1 Tax=Trypanosoma grayi TaxID=71804 RepID=UPI0004F4AE7D|nr:hypothetical protein DQ04_00321100 [Trypanosoma grayi]KEG14741.1 hypothetical protein DQ04_00321100 [Trypanosoma grayi]
MTAMNGFLMDYSLNRVAKYLRLLGYSAVCDPYTRQCDLLEMAARDKLALVASSPTLISQVEAHNRALTKRKTVPSQMRTVVAYDSDGESIYSDESDEGGEVVLYKVHPQFSADFFSAMVRLIRETGICYDYRRVFSRCIACNEVLLPVPKWSVAGDVHSKVYEIYEAFTRCPRCHKVFWGLDGTTVVSYTSFRTLELLQRLCCAAGAPGSKPSYMASLRYFRAFPRAVHALVVSFLPDNDLRTFVMVFPRLKEMTATAWERMKLKG